MKEPLPNVLSFRLVIFISNVLKLPFFVGELLEEIDLYLHIFSSSRCGSCLLDGGLGLIVIVSIINIRFNVEITIKTYKLKKWPLVNRI